MTKILFISLCTRPSGKSRRESFPKRRIKVAVGDNCCAKDQRDESDTSRPIEIADIPRSYFMQDSRDKDKDGHLKYIHRV
jgi:hypothetical protein